jgi:cytochrome c oxidase subunit III
MVVFIASWAMLFAMLFLSYLLLRTRATAWPPPELPRLPRLLPAIATMLLAGSSAAVHRGTRGALALGALLGAGFLALQSVVWRQMYLAGLHLGAGAYASVFYGLTAFHALHVLVGLGALTWLSVRPRRAAARLWAIYWHMVGVIWAVMFTLVYLL